MKKSNRKQFVTKAIVEIVLITVGILIALQIENWNEARKQKELETNLLQGIKSDFEADILDISGNLRWYREFDSLAVNIFQAIDSNDHYNRIARDLLEVSFFDHYIFVHSSFYEAAKNAGFFLEDNFELNQQIVRIHEYYYKTLILKDNKARKYNFYKDLAPITSKYLQNKSWEQNHVYYPQLEITEEQFQKLRSDEELKFLLNFHRHYTLLLIGDYEETILHVEAVIKSIDQELKKR